MRIIPKEEIERQNTLRLDLSNKKDIFAERILEQYKKDNTFTGDFEQINALPDGETKTMLLVGYASCEAAAAKIPDVTWLNDVKNIVERLKEEQENNEENN